MICRTCYSHNVEYEVLTETKEGHEWEIECFDCGWFDIGYYDDKLAKNIAKRMM